jgi:hypothetical protein
MSKVTAKDSLCEKPIETISKAYFVAHLVTSDSRTLKRQNKRRWGQAKSEINTLFLEQNLSRIGARSKSLKNGAKIWKTSTLGWKQRHSEFRLNMMKMIFLQPLHVWSGRYLIRIGLRLLSQLSAEKKDRDESGSHSMTDCVHHWQYIVSKLDGAPCARYHGPTKSLISCGHSLYPQRWIENNWHTWNISKGRRRFAARTQGGRCQCLATCYHAVRTVACHVPVFAYQSGLNNIIISCIIPILPTCHIIEAHHRTLVITRINPGASDWRATSAECSGGASFPKLKIDVSC